MSSSELNFEIETVDGEHFAHDDARVLAEHTVRSSSNFEFEFYFLFSRKDVSKKVSIKHLLTRLDFNETVFRHYHLTLSSKSLQLFDPFWPSKDSRRERTVEFQSI